MDAHRPKWCSKCREERPWVRVQQKRGLRKSSMRRCIVCNSVVRARKPKVAGADKRADALWSVLVKRGKRCFFAGRILHGKIHECGGWLEAMHGIPRGYYGTRWLLDNGFCGCRDLHHYFSRRKEEWAFQLSIEWGAEKFKTLWDIARQNRTKEPAKWLAYLQEADHANATP